MILKKTYKKNLSFSLENQKIKTYIHSNDQVPIRKEDYSPHPLYSILSPEYTDSWTSLRTMLMRTRIVEVHPSQHKNYFHE
jgi:hypothetical protein